MLHRLPLFLLAISAVACATTPVARIDAPVLTPGAGESVALDRLIVLLDASSSITEGRLFEQQQALAESFARSAPNGNYAAGAIGFGGFRRQNQELASFDRERLVAYTTELPQLSEGTPIHKAIGEAGALLEGGKGRAAVLLYSDGVITDEGGRDLDGQLALDRAAGIAESFDGQVCFHTVQTGNDPEGEALLRSLAATTSCGSFRPGAAIDSVASLQQLERDVFIATQRQVAAAPRDTDRDGVIDPEDECPGTPLGASVNRVGCWFVQGLYFATDRADINAKGKQGLDEVVAVLEANPDLRVRIAGHTDAQGSERYNASLSDRRAAVAREYLVSAGIDPKRLESKGYGEAKPVDSNATPEGRQRNRRTEIELIR